RAEGSHRDTEPQRDRSSSAGTLPAEGPLGFAQRRRERRVLIAVHAGHCVSWFAWRALRARKDFGRDQGFGARPGSSASAALRGKNLPTNELRRQPANTNLSVPLCLCATILW